MKNENGIQVDMKFEEKVEHSTVIGAQQTDTLHAQTVSAQQMQVDKLISTDPEQEKLKQPGGVARKFIQELKNKIGHQENILDSYVPLLAMKERPKKEEHLKELMSQVDMLPDS